MKACHCQTSNIDSSAHAVDNCLDSILRENLFTCVTSDSVYAQTVVHFDLMIDGEFDLMIDGERRTH
jgi:hypothetical protein